MPKQRVADVIQNYCEKQYDHIVHLVGSTGTAAPAKRRAFLLLITCFQSFMRTFSRD